MMPLVEVLSAFLLPAAFAEERKTTPLFPDDDWLAWLHIDYPSSFTLDPKSFQGEAKWWARLVDPDSDLSVEVSSYSYISELELILTIPDITSDNYVEKLGLNDPDTEGPSTEELIAAKATCKNAGDYFRAHVAPKDSEVSKIHGYERFIHRGKDKVLVHFLDPDAYQETGGRLYQTLRFTFNDGNFETHRKTIDAILATAKPSCHPRDDEEASVGDPEEDGDQKPSNPAEEPKSETKSAIKP
jgi:hypothetical protein